MGNVTPIRSRPRRLENPESQLGRVYLVLRDADYWLQLHERCRGLAVPGRTSIG